MDNPFSNALASITGAPNVKFDNPWQMPLQQPDYLAPAMGVSEQAFQGAKNAAQEGKNASEGMVNATNVLENLFNGEGMAFEYKPSVSKQVQAYESGSIESETPYLSGRQQTIARGGRLGARAAAQQWEEENPGQTAPLSISDPEEFQRIINRYNAPNSGAAKGTQPMSGAGRGGRGGRGGGGQISPMEAELYYQDYIKKALAKDPFGSRGANPRSVVEEFLIKNREKEQANLYNEYKKELDSLTSGRGTPGTWEPRMANTGINF